MAAPAGMHDRKLFRATCLELAILPLNQHMGDPRSKCQCAMHAQDKRQGWACTYLAYTGIGSQLLYVT